jgi:hypothetical protein
MKIKDMFPGIRYRVLTNGSTLKAGERVYKELDGSLVDVDMKGWLNKGEWEKLRNAVILDAEYYHRKIAAAEKSIAECRKILEDHK